MSLGRNEFVGLSARPTTALKSRVMACRMKRSACTSNYNPGVMICRAKRPTYNRIEIEGDGLPDEAFGLHFKLQSWRIDLSGEAFVLHSKLESWVGRALRPTIFTCQPNFRPPKYPSICNLVSSENKSDTAFLFNSVSLMYFKNTSSLAIDSLR